MLALVHPKLVALVGVCLQQRPWLCVVEFLRFGDLAAVLRACVASALPLTVLEDLCLLTQVLRLSLAGGFLALAS